MAMFFKSLKNIYSSNSRKQFILSILALLCWIIAIGLAVNPELLPVEHGNLIVSIFLAVSVVFSLNAIPRTSHSQIAHQPANKQKEAPEH